MSDALLIVTKSIFRETLHESHALNLHDFAALSLLQLTVMSLRCFTRVLNDTENERSQRHLSDEEQTELIKKHPRLENLAATAVSVIFFIALYVCSFKINVGDDEE